jgi:transposase
LLKRHAIQRLAQIDRQIAAINAALKLRLQTEPELASRFAILVWIPGVGALTAVTMPIEMPELGQLDNKQVASLAGLAPQARESGQHRGRRHIRGGRSVLRQALYMPALVATRFNVDMKAKYQALIKAESPRRLPSQQSCGNLSFWQTHCSKLTENGPTRPLDHNGYSRRAECSCS